MMKSIVLLFLIAGLVLIFGIANADPCESTCSGKCKVTKPLVPTWRIQVQMFDYDYGSVNVYHKLGESYDIGIGISGRIENDQNDGSKVFTDRVDPQDSYNDDFDYYQNKQFSIGTNLDIRKWSAITDKLSWFWGPRLICGYSDSKDRNVDYGSRGESTFRSTTTRKYERLGLAVSGIVGGDFSFYRRLSVSFVISPIKYLYTWENRDIIQDAVHDSGNQDTTAKTTNHREEGYMEYSFRAFAYLTLSL